MRQSNVVAATVLAAALAAASTTSAQARPDAQTKPTTPALAPGLSSKPYSRLFEQQRSQASEALRKMRPNSARRFICAIHVLPADPTVDPRFEKAPADKTTRFSMRVVSPTACH